MNTRSTLVWGIAADQAGIVQQYSYETEELPGGGQRVEARSQLDHEPASDYARTHPAPMPMRWQHGETIGSIVALRRAHGNLYAVGETDLAPDELATLAGSDGLRWSTGTRNRRNEPLRIEEISLAGSVATNGLPPVSWYRFNATKGNVPDWVAAELDRADSRIERRSRRSGELHVHDLDAGMELGLRPSDSEYRRLGERLEIEHSNHPGRILTVEGRPVGGDR